jgi:xanthine dehydrogenase YagT iron-sulfur-binding subunit
LKREEDTREDSASSEPTTHEPLGAVSRRAFIGLSVGAVPMLRATVAGAKALKPATGGTHAATAAGSATYPISLEVNGRPHQLRVDPRSSLLDTLREELALTGTKKGCDHGQCGACTVLLDGRRVVSCLTLAAMASGHQVTTVEGLAQGDQLHPVQAAFLKHDGFQCGYCTPGQIVSAVGLLAEGCPDDPAAIRECMSGNLCRCGAYPNIVAAVQEAHAATPAKGGRA